jgi:NitT/TauT family transport system substrate-binding protein
MLNRSHSFTRRSLLAATASAGLAGGSIQSVRAQDKPLRKVRIGVGTRVMSLSYPWLTMPAALGYWKQEGLDVELMPIGGSLEAVQQIAAGNVDFVQVNSAVVVQGVITNGLPLRTVMLNTVNDWSVVALADGPIRTVADFRGKSIGVPALSSGGMPLLKELLLHNGLKPDSDVSIIGVGYGAPGYQAIRSGKVDGLMFFQAGIAGFENQGGVFRYFHGEDWRKQPDFALVTMQGTIDRDPALVEAVVRGAVKGSVFSMASPDCARRMQWRTWPDTKPSGAPDEATAAKWDLHNLAAQQLGMKDALDLSGGALWGRCTPEQYAVLQDFLLRAGLIPKALPPETFMVGIPGFFEKVNDFDAAEIRAAAESCA